jgi:hypothetical protein
MKLKAINVRKFDGTCLDTFLFSNEKMFDTILKNARKCYGDDIIIEAGVPNNVK